MVTQRTQTLGPELKRLRLIIQHLYDAKSEQTDEVLLLVANKCLDGIEKMAKEHRTVVKIKYRNVVREKIVERECDPRHCKLAVRKLAYKTLGGM